MRADRDGPERIALPSFCELKSALEHSLCVGARRQGRSGAHRSVQELCDSTLNLESREERVHWGLRRM